MDKTATVIVSNAKEGNKCITHLEILWLTAVDCIQCSYWRVWGGLRHCSDQDLGCLPCLEGAGRSCDLGLILSTHMTTYWGSPILGDQTTCSLISKGTMHVHGAHTHTDKAPIQLIQLIEVCKTLARPLQSRGLIPEHCVNWAWWCLPVLIFSYSEVETGLGFSRRSLKTQER